MVGSIPAGNIYDGGDIGFDYAAKGASRLPALFRRYRAVKTNANDNVASKVALAA